MTHAFAIVTYFKTFTFNGITHLGMLPPILPHSTVPLNTSPHPPHFQVKRI